VRRCAGPPVRRSAGAPVRQCAGRARCPQCAAAKPARPPPPIGDPPRICAELIPRRFRTERRLDCLAKPPLPPPPIGDPPRICAEIVPRRFRTERRLDRLAKPPLPPPPIGDPPRICAGILLYRHAHRLSTCAAEPSRSHPSSCAGSFNCCPRIRETTRNRQLTSGNVVMSPHSFSNCATGNTSS